MVSEGLKSQSENTFKDQKNYTQQKDDDRYPIDSMHHLNIYIRWSRWILSSEKIATHFAQRKELLPSPFLVFHMLVLFHITDLQNLVCRLQPVAVFTNDINQFINRLGRRNILAYHVLSLIQGYSTRT